MNKVVKQHIPVAELPQHLREGLDPDALVTLELTVEPRPTLKDILARRQNNYASSDEIDEHVRSLRAEWSGREL
ncbi:hypothetical protein [Salinarimonas chemoclinalis]|uniref:hypothetical protein n=1 Tax=Salinarimonas chemoclinalis TaxID=3241599 RepID=UPI0035560E9D